MAYKQDTVPAYRRRPLSNNSFRHTNIPVVWEAEVHHHFTCLYLDKILMLGDRILYDGSQLYMTGTILLLDMSLSKVYACVDLHIAFVAIVK